MPAYTILIMRRDATDRRPHTLHISGGLFWSVILAGIGLPILGFGVSAGYIAPAWLKFNFDRLERQVEGAKQTEQNNANLTADNQKLADQLQSERSSRAEAEARLTMAETARIEANNRLTELEAENVNLRRDLASYERMLKPKIDKELVECADISAKAVENGMEYAATISKISGNVTLPPSLTAVVSVLSGNNVVTLDQSGKVNKTTNHALDLKKSQKISGKITANLPTQATRVLDIKIKDATRVVGYCWKSF